MKLRNPKRRDLEHLCHRAPRHNRIIKAFFWMTDDELRQCALVKGRTKLPEGSLSIAKRIKIINDLQASGWATAEFLPSGQIRMRRIKEKES